MQPTEYFDSAHRLVRRDEAEEGRPLGQDVRETFHQADFFIDAQHRPRMEEELARIMEIVFGHPFRTPTRDEQAIFLAEAAAMRSAEMGRQVGAVIATPQGDVISVGTNEVPRAGGGLYWEGDPDDSRDFLFGEDTSDAMKRRVVGELRDRLLERGWIADAHKEASSDDLYEAIRGTRVGSLIEFGRAVHAEMAALIDAARRGAPVADCTLYVTTFPCHGCTRHIVAAGIQRVVYIAPYSKSLAAHLHSDSIRVDPDQPANSHVTFESFVGVAPRAYLEHFGMLSRKDKKGQAMQHTKRTAMPRFLALEPKTTVLPYLQNELIALDLLRECMDDSTLKLRQ